MTDLSNGLEEAAYLNSLNETDEVNDEVTLIEELLIDLLQLVHGTIKKLVPHEVLANEEEGNGGGSDDPNNTISGSSEVDAKSAILKAKSKGPSFRDQYLLRRQFFTCVYVYLIFSSRIRRIYGCTDNHAIYS